MSNTGDGDYTANYKVENGDQADDNIADSDDEFVARIWRTTLICCPRWMLSSTFQLQPSLDSTRSKILRITLTSLLRSFEVRPLKACRPSYHVIIKAKYPFTIVP